MLENLNEENLKMQRDMAKTGILKNAFDFLTLKVSQTLI